MATAFSEDYWAPVSAAPIEPVRASVDEARPLPPSWMIARDFGAVQPPLASAPAIAAPVASVVYVADDPAPVPPAPVAVSAPEKPVDRYLRSLPIPEMY